MSQTIQNRKLPVSKGHWLFQNIPAIAKNPMLFAYRKTQELGDTFEAPLVLRNSIITTNLDFIKHILINNQRNYTKSPTFDHLALILGNGLVNSRGDFWRKQRRLAQPAFYKKNLATLFLSMGETVMIYFDDLEKKSGDKINLVHEMMQITAQIATKALFSSDDKEDFDKLYQNFTETQRYVAYRIRNPFYATFSKFNGHYKKFQKELAVLDEVVWRFINERKAQNQQGVYPADLLQMLLDAKDAETGEGMDGKQLRDEVMTMFNAGHETSANALIWTFYSLTQHPEVVEKLRTEGKAVVKGKIPTFAELRQMPYHRQVLEESMRLYPPAWTFSRMALKDDVWQGVEIKKGVPIYIAIYSLHRSPNFYENPTIFNPDRFAPEAVKARPKLSYMPFGAGPRQCIGFQFAMMEMQLLLYGLTQRFDFELVKNQKVEIEPLITLRPKEVIWVKIKTLKKESSQK